eukprot:5357335-Amphidinium_carterae.1
MDIVDSEAVFATRAAQVGLSERQVAEIKAKGWTTYTLFALSSTYIPGQENDKQFLEKVALPVLGSVDHVDLP